MSSVRGQLVRVVRVPQILDGVVQNDVQQRVEPLESPAGLPATGKLYTDLLVNEPGQNIVTGIILQSSHLFRSKIDSFFFLSPPPSAALLGADMVGLD